MIGGAAAPSVLPVDLGLPSGTLWADRNLGAYWPSDVGLYFSWGNVIGHRYGDGYSFSDVSYASTSGAAIDTDLTGDSDAAHVILGGSWCMPSADLVQELIDNCDIAMITHDNATVYRLTSRSNGAQLILPADGIIYGVERPFYGERAYYFTAKLYNASYSLSLLLDGDSSSVSQLNRSRGAAIRACIPGTI